MTKSTWTVDGDHSSIEFSVKHMMIANVKGTFNKFTANVIADPEDLTDAEIDFTVDVSSIDTRNKDRDGHLLSGDFLDAEKYPTINFVGKEAVKTGETEYDVKGELTIHGVTKPAVFAVTFEGQGKDPWGNEKAGFSGTSKINRRDYGLVWNAALETGGVLIGDDIKISLQIEASKQA